MAMSQPEVRASSVIQAWDGDSLDLASGTRADKTAFPSESPVTIWGARATECGRNVSVIFVVRMIADSIQNQRPHTGVGP